MCLNFGYNIPFINYFMPNWGVNFFPRVNFMQNWQQEIMPTPFSIFRQNNYRQNTFFPGNSIFQNKIENSSIDNLESRLATSTPETIQTNQNLFHGVKYNEEKGERLADTVLADIPTEREKPLCARYVKLAMLKNGLSPYIDGNGEYCKYILRANNNFKEINVNGNELSSLPKGSVVVYNAGTEVSNSKGETWNIGENGHVLVALGDGRGASDIIDEEIPQCNNAYTFIPV